MLLSIHAPLDLRAFVDPLFQQRVAESHEAKVLIEAMIT